MYILAAEKNIINIFFLPHILTKQSGKELIESKEQLERETSTEVILHS